MQDTFADLFTGIEGLESSESEEFVQTGAQQKPLVNKTQFNNPPVPRTAVPANPCNDPDAGAPSAADKRAAKCTIKKSPQCYKLQERFLLIQSGIQDERDELMEAIAKMEQQCEETKLTLCLIQFTSCHPYRPYRPYQALQAQVMHLEVYL
jgi:hypothetical protein